MLTRRIVDERNSRRLPVPPASGSIWTTRVDSVERHECVFGHNLRLWLPDTLRWRVCLPSTLLCLWNCLWVWRVYRDDPTWPYARWYARHNPVSISTRGYTVPVLDSLLYLWLYKLNVPRGDAPQQFPHVMHRINIQYALHITEWLHIHRVKDHSLVALTV